MAMTKATFIDIYAVGNVLDPHIRIEGKCRSCDGKGCELCGDGNVSELVRLADLVMSVGPAFEYITTVDRKPEN